MKKLIFFLASSITLLLFVLLSCNKSELQEQTENDTLYNETETVTLDNIAVTNRADCDDCGVDDCCCAVEILSSGTGTSAPINLCGTTDGFNGCGPATPGSPCFTNVSGGGQTLNLDLSLNPREAFCMAKNATFWLANTGNDAVDLKVTCQHDQTNPQTYQFSISPSERIYINNDGDCVVAKCQ